MPRKPFRLPLQLGTSAVRHLAWCGVVFVPAVAVLGWAVPALQATGGPLVDNKYLGMVGFAVVVAPLVFAFYHLTLLVLRWPSDIELLDDGFVVRRWLARSFRWAGVRGLAFDPRDPTGLGSDMLLTVRSDDTVYPEPVELASTSEPSERRSLQTVFDALEQYRAWRDAPAEPAAAGVELLRCSGCGANLAPIDEDDATCPHCLVRTPVKRAIRERVRAHAAAAPGAELEQVARLLSSTKLLRTRLLMGLGVVLMLGAWPLVVWLMKNHETDGSALSVALSILFVPALIVPTYCALRLQLVDRIALPVVLLGCAVAGPDVTCGDCLGPLPRKANAGLVECVYCGAANVLELDLRPRAAAVKQAQRLVSDALERRRQERARWHRATRATAWLFGVALLSLAIAARLV